MANITFKVIYCEIEITHNTNGVIIDMARKTAYTQKDTKVVDGVIVMPEYDTSALEFENPPADNIFLYCEDDGFGNSILKFKRSDGSVVNFLTEISSGDVKNTTRYTDSGNIRTEDEVVVCNTDSGSFNRNLPSGIEGQTFRIVNSGSSGNTLDITPSGLENLMGANSPFSLSDGESIIITYNANDGWY